MILQCLLFLYIYVTPTRLLRVIKPTEHKRRILSTTLHPANYLKIYFPRQIKSSDDEILFHHFSSIFRHHPPPICAIFSASPCTCVLRNDKVKRYLCFRRYIKHTHTQQIRNIFKNIIWLSYFLFLNFNDTDCSDDLNSDFFYHRGLR